MLLKTDLGPVAIDTTLLAKAEAEGGFLTSLSFTDRQRLRKITKGVHMKHYPQEMLTDYEADRIIEAMAPETQKYLIERMWEHVK